MCQSSRRVEVAHGQRARADERHLAAQHVEELGQLVEREAPQEAPDGVSRGSSRILNSAPRGLVERLEVGLLLVGARAHGAELQAGEGLAADPGRARAVDDRPARGQPDGQRDEQEQRAEHDQQEARPDEVERPLDRVVDALEHGRA